MLGHRNRAASLRITVVAKYRDEGQGALEKRRHDMVDNVAVLVQAGEIARDQIAVLNYEVGMLDIKDRIHDAGGLRILVSTSSWEWSMKRGLQEGRGLTPPKV
jgi:hypothetical protein